MSIRINYAPMNNAPTTAESANGTLTAEQVMAIAGKHQPDYCSDTHVCFDWQAIADELSARAERTCRNLAEPDEMSDDPFTCSECGARGPYGDGIYHIGGCEKKEDGSVLFWDSWPVYKYCPNCGAKVVGE